MNPGRFFMPNMGATMSPMFRASYLPIRNNIGLFSRITNSIKSFNWGGLLNGANKTLNIVNQTIPLVRQAGPMVNNMRSMLRLAKAFGSETNIASNTKQEKAINKVDDVLINDNNVNKKEDLDSNYPNFFV